MGRCRLPFTVIPAPFYRHPTSHTVIPAQAGISDHHRTPAFATATNLRPHHRQASPASLPTAIRATARAAVAAPITDPAGEPENAAITSPPPSAQLPQPPLRILR